MNRFKLEQMLRGIGQELKDAQNKLDNMYGDSGTTLDVRNKQKEIVKDLQDRFSGMKDRLDTLDLEAQEKNNNENMEGLDPKAKITKAKAELFRNVIRNKQVDNSVKAMLGDNNSSGGEKFLPTTLTNELLHEPFVTNPLRKLSVFTSVLNLEIPRISFKLDDDSFIKDGETANELKANGDSVVFKRNKFKIYVPISETVLSSTDTNLVATVEAGLQSGLAQKEKNVAFTETPKSGEENMSFYKVGIKEVEGNNLYQAILNALGDLEDEYAENASVTMTRSDYYNIIATLANNNASLYTAQPKQVLGFDVEFCSKATKPVVGDYRYSHFNYDPGMIYDRDKDIKAGIELFVLTAWFDHQIKMKSAFRIAKVTPSSK